MSMTLICFSMRYSAKGKKRETLFRTLFDKTWCNSPPLIWWTKSKS